MRPGVVVGWLLRMSGGGSPWEAPSFWVAVVLAVLNVVQFVVQRRDVGRALRAAAEEKHARIAADDEHQVALAAEVAERKKLAADLERIANALEQFWAKSDVDWVLEPAGKDQLWLRNEGAVDAHQVRIDDNRLKDTTLVTGGLGGLLGDIEVGESKKIILVQELGGPPLPGELWVRCDEAPEWVPVRRPPMS